MVLLSVPVGGGKALPRIEGSWACAALASPLAEPTALFVDVQEVVSGPSVGETPDEGVMPLLLVDSKGPL